MSRYLFLIGSVRSGTTWLQQTLNSHEDIALHGELLNPDVFGLGLQWRQKLPQTMQQRVTRMIRRHPLLLAQSTSSIQRRIDSSTLPWKGCKITARQLYGTPQNVRKRKDFLGAFPAARCILLFRNNVLASAVSAIRSLQTSVWHSNDHEQTTSQHAEKPVHVPVQKLLNTMEQIVHNREMLIREVAERKLSTLETTYEELFADKERVLQEIATFLDIEPTFAHSSLEKMRTTPLQVLIENYEELEKALESHPNYLAMLQAD